MWFHCVYFSEFCLLASNLHFQQLQQQKKIMLKFVLKMYFVNALWFLNSITEGFR